MPEKNQGDAIVRDMYEDALDYADEMSDMWFEAEEKLDQANERIRQYQKTIRTIYDAVKDQEGELPRLIQDAIRQMRRSLKSNL